MSVLLNSLLFVSSIVNACEEIIEAQQWAILTASGIASFSCKVVAKAVVRGARRGATKTPKQKSRINSDEKRKEITLTCRAKAAARAAKAKQEATQMASCGNTLSAITIAARAAQASAQKAVNAVRKLQALITPKKVKVNNEKTITGILVVKSSRLSLREEWELKSAFQGPVKGSNTKIADTRNELKTCAHIKEAKQKDLSIAKAKKAAMRQKWIELRREKIARICANAWMKKGIWVDSFLAEACNDSDYEVREKAYRELLALIGGAK